MTGGWVQLRRGIMEHVIDGRLTPAEYLALVQLILLADSATGAGTINGPTLLYWTGYAFSIDTAQRVLKSLTDKGYIRYTASQSKRVQPYTINKYLLTTGPDAGRMTDITSTAVDTATSDQQPSSRADDPAGDKSGDASGLLSDVLSDEGRGDTSDNYDTEKDTNTNKEKENTPTVSSKTASVSPLISTSGRPSDEGARSDHTRIGQRTSVAASGSASSERIIPVNHSGASRPEPGNPSCQVSSVVTHDSPRVFTPLGFASIPPFQAKLVWFGEDRCFRDLDSLEAVPEAEARRRLGIAVERATA